MGVAARLFAVPTIEEFLPFAYIASIISEKVGAADCAVACKPSREYAFGEFLIGRAVSGSIDFEMGLDEETLKLHSRLKIWRCEETFNALAKLWCFFNAVKMLVPVFRRICKQMMVLYFLLGDCNPVLGFYCQNLRIFVLG